MNYSVSTIKNNLKILKIKNMKILLDTNIVIHRETSSLKNENIWVLFYWIDNLRYQKYIHPITISELERHWDKNILEVMAVKLSSYNILKNIAPRNKEIIELGESEDKNENDINDTSLLNEAYEDRVDIFITEDKKIHRKASMLWIWDRVHTIDSFLIKVTSENPDFIGYDVLSVKKVSFWEVDISDSFFDSFRQDYNGFDKWFNRKSEEICYVCYKETNMWGFLFLKIEKEDESYNDILPIFDKKKRLKIWTFKVTHNWYRLGERFLKIIFDNALQHSVDEIYVTIFNNTEEQIRLIELLKNWWFIHSWIKKSQSWEEQVYTKNFNKSQKCNPMLPRDTYPFFNWVRDFYIVPIYQAYHTELFPDSILRTESPLWFIENQPHRNSLSKVYISRSWEKSMKPWNIVVFYRTWGIHKWVITTYWIIESIFDGIKTEEEFIEKCKRRSVFSQEELQEQWNHSSTKPFIVNFIYSHSFKKRPNLKWLNENGIIPNILDMPRGFRKIWVENFKKIVWYSKSI